MSLDDYSKCPFCGVYTNKLKVFMMGTKSAFIDCDACGRDQEVVWTEKLNNLYGKHIIHKERQYSHAEEDYDDTIMGTHFRNNP